LAIQSVQSDSSSQEIVVSQSNHVQPFQAAASSSNDQLAATASSLLEVSKGVYTGFIATTELRARPPFSSTDYKKNAEGSASYSCKPAA